MSSRIIELEELYKSYTRDKAFDTLKSKGSKFIPGAGQLKPKLMIIGEAPGQDENDKGRPFAARIGEELKYLLKGNDIDPDDVFYTNLVKYYDPTRERKDAIFLASYEYLIHEIEIVDPLIVGLCGLPVTSTFYPDIKDVYPYNGMLLDEMYVPLANPAIVTHSSQKTPAVRRGFSKLKGYIDAKQSILEKASQS